MNTQTTAIDKAGQSIIEAGQALAPEILPILTESSINTILAWMRENDAPEELINLTDITFSLCVQEAFMLKGQKIDDLDAHDLVVCYPEVKGYITTLGGVMEYS